eukprot:scaffold217_cov377-Prasinococcus_capsulatus_cf.AAC.6
MWEVEEYGRVMHAINSRCAQDTPLLSREMICGRERGGTNRKAALVHGVWREQARRGEAAPGAADATTTAPGRPGFRGARRGEGGFQGSR